MTNRDVRKWFQAAVGVLVLAYGVFSPGDAHRLWFIGIGAGLVDAEHALRALGIWKAK